MQTTEQLIRGRLRKAGWLDRYTRYSNQIVAIGSSKPARPKVSCVVITYRHIEFMHVVLGQLKRRDDVEIVFVNNGGLAPQGAHLGLVDKYIVTGKNDGAYLARNIGAIFADGDYLCFVDDDGIPCNGFIDAFMDAFKEYDIVSAQGCCQPRTRTVWNFNAHHYYLGGKPFPYFTNLEGACCIDRKVFFPAGGWDDDLDFGGGGYNLTKRMLAIEPNKLKYAYIPGAVLHHDYVQSLGHLKKKAAIQGKRTRERMIKDMGYNYENTVYRYLAHNDLLIRRGDGATC